MAGDLPETAKSRLWTMVTSAIDPTTDSCIILKIGDQQFEAVQSIGKPLPLEQIKPSTIALFF